MLKYLFYEEKNNKKRVDHHWIQWVTPFDFSQVRGTNVFLQPVTPPKDNWEPSASHGRISYTTPSAKPLS